MPYTPAHPAAVLPFRQLCPRYLSWPALAVGSVVPDLGYLWDRGGVFTHHFVTGTFLFGLPVGALILGGLRLVWPWIVRFGNSWCRKAVFAAPWVTIRRPLCQIVSLTIGIWTHLLLDSLTHEDGWIVVHSTWLQMSLWTVGSSTMPVYEILYDAFTLGGVVWLALAYAHWLEAVFELPEIMRPLERWTWALGLGTLILWFSIESRGDAAPLSTWIGAVLAGMTGLAIVLGMARRACRLSVSQLTTPPIEVKGQFRTNR